jgi:hypothetical protein
MSLPVLTENEVNELVRESKGNAVSFTDAPDWYCGVRKVTCMARDGMTEGEYMGPGTCNALAGSLCGHVMDYQRAINDYRYCIAQSVSIRKERDTEDSRKKPRVRRVESLSRELRQALDSASYSLRRAQELRAKYFRGYERRLLIEEEKTQ